MISQTSPGQQLENLTLDWRFRARAASDPAADPRLLGVGIDERGLEQWGRWPWPREIHAGLLDLLTQRPPKVIAFDLMFTEPSPNASEDAAFGDKLLLFPGAITGASADHAVEGKEVFDEIAIGNSKAIAKVQGDISQLEGHDTAVFPVPILAESSLTGFVNAPPGPDGMRRELPLVVRCGKRVFPSFGLQMLLALEGVDADSVEVKLGKSVTVQAPARRYRIPIDARGQMRLNYRRPDSFLFTSYQTLAYQLNEAAKGQPWPEAFPKIEGQVLVVGQVASGLTDLGPSPHSSVTPLMMIHLNALNNILREDYIREAPLWPVLSGWMILAIAGVFLLRRAPVWLLIAGPLTVIGLYIWAAYLLFAHQSLQVPVFWPVAGFAFFNTGTAIQRLVIESRAKARIKGLFGTYVAPTVVEQMIASGEEPKLGGAECEITAFFSDIAGFSSFSEQLTPHQLVTLMNEYLTEMTDILHDHGGTLDKFIGDAIVGMFGAPIHFVGHAYEACRTAAEMQRRQLELCEKWARDGQYIPLVHEMRTRIGLNSGRAIIGNMGSRRRFNYTMMGDTVNLAARTESGAKVYGVYTMVTNDTRMLAQGIKDDLCFRYLDRLTVKGRSQSVEMYELVGIGADLSPQIRAGLSAYQAGIHLYLDRQWDAARAIFLKSAKLERFPEDNPSLVMSRRCLAFKANPPSDDWQGEYVVTTK